MQDSNSPSEWPDGLAANQKSQFWYIVEGLAMESFGILHGNLVYVVVIWCDHFQHFAAVWCRYFPRFGLLYE
jgi:hypothetical protein